MSSLQPLLVYGINLDEGLKSQLNCASQTGCCILRQWGQSQFEIALFYMQLKVYVTLSLVVGLFFLEPAEEHVLSIARQKLVDL